MKLFDAIPFASFIGIARKHTASQPKARIEPPPTQATRSRRKADRPAADYSHLNKLGAGPLRPPASADAIAEQAEPWGTVAARNGFPVRDR